MTRWGFLENLQDHRFQYSNGLMTWLWGTSMTSPPFGLLGFPSALPSENSGGNTQSFEFLGRRFVFSALMELPKIPQLCLFVWEICPAHRDDRVNGDLTVHQAWWSRPLKGGHTVQILVASQNHGQKPIENQDVASDRESCD